MDLHIRKHRNFGSPPLASIYVEQDIIKQLPSEARHKEMALHIRNHLNLGSPPLASIYVKQDIIKQLPSKARHQEMAFTHCKSIIIANQVLISQQKQITGHTCRDRKHFVTSNYSTRNFPTSRQLQAFFSCKQFATCILLIQAYGNQANRLQAFVLTSICPSS